MAADVIDQVEAIQEYYLEKQALDLFSCLTNLSLAGREIQPYDNYENFPQIENGVGIVALSIRRLRFNKNIQKPIEELTDGTLITGEYAAPIIEKACKMIMNKLPGLKLNVIGIKTVFGTSIKVSGLVTGRDIVSQLKGRTFSKNLFIPENMLRREEPTFLDDSTVKDIEEELGVNIIICKQDGSDVVQNVIKYCR